MAKGTQTPGTSGQPIPHAVAAAPAVPGMPDVHADLEGARRSDHAPGPEPEVSPSEPSAFASLGELRAEQARLGERRRGGEGPELWDAVTRFVTRGALTGVFLDDQQERWSVQSLLDYWVAVLERAGQPRPDSSLVDFNAELAPQIPEDRCPYRGLSAFEERDSAVFFGRDALVEQVLHRLREHPLVALVGPSGCGKSSLAFAGLLPRLRGGALPGSETWVILPPIVPGTRPRAALAPLLDQGSDAGAISLRAALAHAGAVTAATFSPDGSRVATASLDKTARIWNAATGSAMSGPLKHDHEVTAVAFSADGMWLATASGSKARVWDARTGGPVTAPLEHPDQVTAATFGSSGNRLLTICANKTARMWDASTGRPLTPALPALAAVAATLSPDGTRIATVCEELATRVWSAETGEPVTPPLEHPKPITAVGFSPDGRRLITASEDHTARVWDAMTGEPVGLPLEHQAAVTAASFGPDATRVVTVSEDAVQIWDATTGSPVTARLEHQDLVTTAAFSPNGLRLATVSRDNTVRVWDAATGKPTAAIQHDDFVISPVFSPDGSRVVTASWDRTIQVWNATTQTSATAPLEHTDVVTAVAFSPNGTQVVTASRDHTARIWNAASTFVVVIDQFEELFTLCDSEAERVGFVEDLLSLVASPLAHRVVLTVRSDFESFIARHPVLYDRYKIGRVAVTPPNAVELRQTIEGPAELVGLKFEVGVIDRLLQELLGEPAGLPLLQFTLRRLWEERHRNRVTMECYDRVGGGRHALARRADAIYDAMIPEDQPTARRILLLAALAVDDKHELTRTRLLRSQLLTHSDDERGERVLDRLIEERLLRQTVNPHAVEPQVEVAHEALVRNWPRLVNWLQEAQTGRDEQRQLEARAKEWIRLGRGRGGLLDEVALRVAEQVLQRMPRHGLRVSDELIALLNESRIQVQASRARVLASLRRERWRFAIGTVLAIALVVTVAGVAMLASSIRRYRIAQQEDLQQQARLAHSLATSNLESGRLWLLDGHPMQALPYLAAAKAEGIDGSAIRLLFGQAMGSVPSVTLAGHDAAVRSVAFNPQGTQCVTASDDGSARIWPTPWGSPARQTLSHRGPITSAGFSRDGLRVVTVSRDRTARVWDARTGDMIATLEHDGAVRAAAFSPDGRYVATASQNVAQVWNVLTGSKQRTFFEHQGAITSVVFPQDGERLLTASADHTAVIWDTSTGNQLATFKHDGAIAVAAYSADGAHVVTASEDRTARVWDGATGKPITPPLQHQGSVTAAAFSADGKRVVTASDDRTAKVWDAAAGTLATTLEHQDAVIAVAFSPDGTRVATASRDHTARVWEVASGAPITVPLLHPGAITSLAFSPDGKQVATASEDRTARLWGATMKTRVTVTLPHRSPIQSARFSTDGSRVVTAGDDHMVRVWDVRTGAPMTPPFGDRGPLTVAFSEDGRWVVTARKKPPIKESEQSEVTVWDPTVWDVMTGRPAAAPLHHQDEVTAMAFSRDGTRLATASSDLTARVWNVKEGSPLPASFTAQGRVVAVVFSPDGTRLATASKDNNARLWDVMSGKLIATLEHRRGVTAVAFSADGALLITASEDHTARVWNVATGEPITPPLQHHDIVNVAIFSPDARRVLTASNDGTARVWDAASGSPVTPPLEHRQGVTAAAFNFDGTLVATASKDSTARIWDAATGHPLMPPLEHREAVTAVQFSPDGSRVLTASVDGTARVQLLPIATGSAADWQRLARCSSFTLVDNTLAQNPEPQAVCP